MMSFIHSLADRSFYEAQALCLRGFTFSVKKRSCKFPGKEVDKRAHEECGNNGSCSNDCTDTRYRGTGEEVESNACYYTNNVGDDPYILEFAQVPSVRDYERDSIVC